MIYRRNDPEVDYLSLDYLSWHGFTAGVARINPPPLVARRFGERVREERASRGWSQMTLAEHSGLHFTFVSSIERGRRNPTLTTICALAEGLEVDPGRLVEGLRSF